MTIIGAFCDLHLSDDRLSDKLKNLDLIYDSCIEYGVTLLLCTGDVYDKSRPSPELKAVFHKFVNRLRGAGIEFVCIVGNHDLSNWAIHALKEFQHLEIDGVSVYDEPTIHTTQGVSILCCSWLIDKKLLKTVDLISMRDSMDKSIPNYLIGHCSVRGLTLNGRDFDEILEDSHDYIIERDVFDGFDYCILGHIHLPNKVTDNCEYLGSVGLLNWGEYGQQHHMLVIDGDERIYIPYIQREREIVDFDPDFVVDKDTMYKVNVYNSEDIQAARNLFQHSYEYKIINLSERRKRDRGLTLDENLSDDELIQQYFNKDWNTEIEKTWGQLK